MKKLLLISLCTIGIARGLDQPEQVKSGPKLDPLMLSEIDNQSEGHFKIYQVGESMQPVILPNSKLDASIELGKRKINVYPISGSFQSIFVERGYHASGSCQQSSGPYLISFWYGFPTQTADNRIFENFCMVKGAKAKIGLRIYADGSAALYAIDGLKPTQS
ncbi:MAG TPA: hypothetical protein QGF02_01905 [Candidatus Babeliales bacterium]|nr:hypothetical protein [Candidatus Babeliales bacterium]